MENLIFGYQGIGLSPPIIKVINLNKVYSIDINLNSIHIKYDRLNTDIIRREDICGVSSDLHITSINSIYEDFDALSIRLLTEIGAI